MNQILVTQGIIVHVAYCILCLLYFIKIFPLVCSPLVVDGLQSCCRQILHISQVSHPWKVHIFQLRLQLPSRLMFSIRNSIRISSWSWKNWARRMPLHDLKYVFWCKSVSFWPNCLCETVYGLHMVYCILQALNELTALVKDCDDSAVNTLLPYWSKLYTNLVVDVDHKVREATQLSHRAIAVRVGRNLAPHIKQIVPSWFISQCDTHPPAASAAVLAFKVGPT